MKHLFGAIVTSAILCGTSQAQPNLLINGHLDFTQPVEVVPGFSVPKPATWISEGFRTITGPYKDELTSEPWAGPAPTPVTANGSGNPSPNGCSGPDCAVFFKPFTGTLANGPATGHLYQDVAGTPGLTYTMKGWAGAEANYLALQSLFALDFLNVANSVISTATLDLVAGGLFVNNGQPFNYKQYTLAAVAPAGTTKVRARISMIGATPNPVGGGQAFVVDDFELTTPLVLLSAASRRQHAVAGNHDINLPLSGTPAVEPRQAGTAPRIVLNFSTPLPVLTCANFTIVNGACTGVSTFGSSATLSLSPASLLKNTCLKVTATGIVGLTGDTDVAVRLHEGNVTGDANVNLLDLQSIKGQLFQPVTGANFRADVTVNGTINLLDLQAGKSNLFVAPGACP